MFFKASTEEKILKSYLLPVFMCTFLVSCGGGTDSGSSGANPTAGTTASPGTTTGTTDTPVVKSLAVNAADMPACATINKDQLTYVKDLKTFKTCDGGAWVSIDIEGPKGDQGNPGINGELGSKGEQGMTGSKGDAGKDRVFTPSLWDDPITGRHWLLTGYANVPFNISGWQTFDIRTYCPAGWRAPGKAELLSAGIDGMYSSFIAAGITATPTEAYSSDLEHYVAPNFGLDIMLPVPVSIAPTPLVSTVSDAVFRNPQTPGRNIGLYCTKDQ